MQCGLRFEQEDLDVLLSKGKKIEVKIFPFIINI